MDAGSMSGFSDGQTGAIALAIAAGFGAVAAAIRFGIKAIIAVVKNTTEQTAAQLTASNQVIRENTQAFTRVFERLGMLDVRTQNVSGRVVEIHQEISGVHDEPPEMEDERARERERVRDNDIVDDPDEGKTPVQIPRTMHKHRRPQSQPKR